MRKVLVDTGPLVALYKDDDAHHEQCKATAGSLPRGCLTTWPVLTEAAWLLRGHPATVQQLLFDVATGVFVIAPLTPQAIPWIAEFMARYSDLGAQLADATLLYVAEHENLDTVFTLDRRDFLVHRRTDGRPLTLLPDQI